MIVPKEVLTKFWHPIRDSKRNQVRQPADIDPDVDSHRKTEMKDPSTEEGDIVRYKSDLCGGAELKACASEP